MNKRTCPQCNVEKEVCFENFYRSKQTKDGYRSWCKDCFNEYIKNSKQKIKKYHKKYYQKNKQKIKERNKKYRNEHKEQYKKIKKNWIKNHLWYISFDGAKQRCTNPNHNKYKYYGGRGIKFLMTMKDFKYLWFRDKAYNMKKPSIDRKNNNGHYELNNCRFIEHSENLKRSK